jgi:hypothetical protein
VSASAGVVAAAALALAACQRSTEDSAADTSAADASAAANTAMNAAGDDTGGSTSPDSTTLLDKARPASEAAFVSAVIGARNSYQAAPNDMAKGATKAQRKQEVCAALGGSLEVTNWVGTVDELSSNNAGKGVLSVVVGDDIRMSTWNNALSDVDDHTLIEPGSQVFSVASNLSKGMPVTFSGHLFSDDTDCIKTQQFFIDSSMTKPAYVIQFTNVGRLASQAISKATAGIVTVGQVQGQSLPTATAGAAGASGSPQFAMGQTDRQQWERWYASLPPGDYRDGAGWWAGHRSAMAHAPCEGAGSATTGAAWSSGCSAAQQGLAGPDAKRRASPDYRSGWNAGLSNANRVVGFLGTANASAQVASASGGRRWPARWTFYDFERNHSEQVSGKDYEREENPVMRPPLATIWLRQELDAVIPAGTSRRRPGNVDWGSVSVPYSRQRPVVT